METSLTIQRPGELQLSKPIQGLSIYENKAVIAWSSPKIADKLIENKEGTEKALAAVITIKLQDAARKSGVSKSITTEEQSLITADIIEVLQEFPRLRLAEVPLIFDLGAVGVFGDDFQGHSINARTFRAWVKAFEEKVRNELILKQVEAQRIAEELKESQNPFKSSILGDLLLGEALIRKYADLVSESKNNGLDAFPESSVPVDIDLSRIWFKRFKETGLLDAIVPLTNDEKKQMFAEQLDKIKFLKYQWGASWTNEERNQRAKMQCEDIWFRKCIARLITIGTTPEAFEQMLIEKKFIPSSWRENLETMRKEAMA